MQSACSGREYDGLKGLKEEEKKREKGLKERQCVGSPEYKTMPGWVSHRRGSDFIPITVGSQRMALSRRVNPHGLHCETDHSYCCVNNRFKVESRHGERTGGAQ